MTQTTTTIMKDIDSVGVDQIERNVLSPEFLALSARLSIMTTLELRQILARIKDRNKNYFIPKIEIILHQYKKRP